MSCPGRDISVNVSQQFGAVSRRTNFVARRVGGQTSAIAIGIAMTTAR